MRGIRRWRWIPITKGQWYGKPFPCRDVTCTQQCDKVNGTRVCCANRLSRAVRLLEQQFNKVQLELYRFMSIVIMQWRLFITGHFLPSAPKRHSIVRPWGRTMECHLGVRSLTHIIVTLYIYGYAPVIRLKMAISGRHAHIHTDKTDISRWSDS